MEAVKKRPIKPKNYISFLYTYSTSWGTAGDICLIRETVAEESTSKFVGLKDKLALPRAMEKNNENPKLTKNYTTKQFINF